MTISSYRTFHKKTSNHFTSCVYLFIILVSLFHASCKDSSTQPIYSPDNDIREIIIRYQFGIFNIGSSAKNVFFLSFALTDSIYHQVRQRWDPDEDFMRRFASNDPLVKKYSQASFNSNGGVFDSVAHLPGMILHVGEIKYISEDEAAVDGGYYAGGLNGEGDIFYLRRIDGQWWIYRIVTKWAA